MSIDMMELKAKELTELYAMAEELKETIASMETEIKAEMTEREVSEIMAGAYTIRFTEYTTNRLMTGELKKAFPELYTKYTKSYTAHRFTIA